MLPQDEESSSVAKGAGENAETAERTAGCGEREAKRYAEAATSDEKNAAGAVKNNEHDRKNAEQATENAERDRDVYIPAGGLYK